MYSAFVQSFAELQKTKILQEPTNKKRARSTRGIRDNNNCCTFPLLQLKRKKEKKFKMWRGCMTFFAGVTVPEPMNILPPSFNSVPRIGYFLCNTCFFLHIFSNHNRAPKKKEKSGVKYQLMVAEGPKKKKRRKRRKRDKKKRKISLVLLVDWG